MRFLPKAPLQLKTGAKLGSGTMYGKVKCHSYKYPSLYKVVHNPHATVAKVMAIRPLNLYFRKVLVNIKLVEWQNLVAQIANVQLVDGSDTLR